MFGNIFFLPIDSSLSDAHLLYRMMGILEHKEMTLTVFPESKGVKNCYSFPVTGTVQAQIYKDAIAMVEAWIRDLPTKGLPFDRKAIF
ncbi:hypothetical protein N7456_002200 [Penicillium angulare]|uniref:Uncharacterized protein n=1 Tax=Penicillium angulare TaxID=116970 RepID=A0A9W9G7P2_9EURO|nr:hypothetical protein N7456_002200 [Penicillium angulare]